MYMGHAHGAMHRNSHAIEKSPLVSKVKKAYAPVSLPCCMRMLLAISKVGGAFLRMSQGHKLSQHRWAGLGSNVLEGTARHFPEGGVDVISQNTPFKAWDSNSQKKRYMYIGTCSLDS